MPTPIYVIYILKKVVECWISIGHLSFCCLTDTGCVVLRVISYTCCTVVETFRNSAKPPTLLQSAYIVDWIRMVQSWISICYLVNLLCYSYWIKKDFVNFLHIQNCNITTRETLLMICVGTKSI